MTKRHFFNAALLSLGVCVWASCGGEESSGDGGESCTPGESQTCDCAGGEMGVQTCAATGNAFSQCSCEGTGGTGNTGGGANSDCGNGELDGNEACDDGGESEECTANCTISSCGDGIINATAGEKCDPGTEFDCPNDCDIGGGGAGGAPSCDEVITYAGMTDVQPSNWSGNGQFGLDAGNFMCNQASFGSHVCTYSELLIAEAKGEFGSIPDGTTAWIHRTVPAMSQSGMSDPGPGGRCNDWTYFTDHLSDGEYASFTGGVPTYNLDSNTFFPMLDMNGNVMGPGPQLEQGPGGKMLPCGAVDRNIFCCYPCAE